MEQKNQQEKPQDPRFVVKEEEEEIDPWTQQSQPYPEEEENIEEESQMEILQQSNLPEKNQDFSPTERSIVKRHMIRYAATRIKKLFH